MQTSVFIDQSGSTNYCVRYWDAVLETIEAHGKSASYYVWDTKAVLVPFEKATEIAKRRKGDGGTSPECFAPIAADKGSHIVIITDGEVSSQSVSRCDAILKSREFASVKVYFFKTGGSINLSVSAPFTRKTDYTIYREGQVIAVGSTRKSTVLREYFGDPDRFLFDAEGILQELTMANMGVVNTARRDELLELQKSLLATLATRSMVAGAKDRFASLRESFSAKSLSDCHEEVRQLISGGDGDGTATSPGKRVQSAIQLMVKQCSGSGDFSFANLEPGRLRRADAVNPLTVADVTPEEDYKGNFNCPITLDSDLPTLLLAAGDPVLDGIEKKKYVDATISNPLVLLNDSALVKKVKARLDHVYGLSGTQLLFGGKGVEVAAGGVKSPTTRRPISAAFTFGLDQAHKDATNFALADLLFGRKLVGQSELWLAVVYFIVKDTPYLASDSDFVTAFKAHMVHRMRTQTTYMTLCGLPVEPMVRCPVDIAIWYCVNSPLIVRNSNLLEDDRNRLRSFGAGAKYMVELLEGDVLGYPYDRTWTLRHLSFYKAFAWMMKADKSEDSSKWRLKLRTQFQNSITLSDGTVVLLDGPASLSERRTPHLLNSTVSIGGESYTLSVGELVALSRLVDRTKTVGVVKIPLDLQAAVEGQDADYTVVQNYGYEPGVQYPFPVSICPATLRPYSIDRKERRQWQELSESMYGPIQKQLSVNSLFIKYVVDHKQFPASQEELIKYMATKQANREDGQAKDTLPTQTMYSVQRVFAAYEEILGGPGFTDITAKEFAHKSNVSKDKKRRADLDEKKTFLA